MDVASFPPTLTAVRYADETLRITPMDDRLGLSLSGALDQTSLAAVRSALAAASAYTDARPDGPVGFALDMSGLHFVSVAGLRVLVLATSPEQRVRGAEVVGVSAPLRRLLHVTRWEQFTHWLIPPGRARWSAHAQAAPSSEQTGAKAIRAGARFGVRSCASSAPDGGAVGGAVGDDGG